MSERPVSYNFRFVPILPTKEAWQNRPFKEYNGLDVLQPVLVDYERNNKSIQLEGVVRFKPGIRSKYYDGTEAQPYDNRKWWELGYSSCPTQCCFSPPFKPLLDWRAENEEPIGENLDELTRLMKEMSRIDQEGYERHLAKPNPMPKFKRKTIPPGREWQEFRRVKGPGGLLDQLSQIENIGDINCITLTHLGWFYVEPV